MLGYGRVNLPPIMLSQHAACDMWRIKSIKLDASTTTASAVHTYAARYPDYRVNMSASLRLARVLTLPALDAEKILAHCSAAHGVDRDRLLVTYTDHEGDAIVIDNADSLQSLATFMGWTKPLYQAIVLTVRDKEAIKAVEKKSRSLARRRGSCYSYDPSTGEYIDHYSEDEDEHDSEESDVDDIDMDGDGYDNSIDEVSAKLDAVLDRLDSIDSRIESVEKKTEVKPIVKRPAPVFTVPVPVAPKLSLIPTMGPTATRVNTALKPRTGRLVFPDLDAKRPELTQLSDDSWVQEDGYNTSDVSENENIFD